MPLEKISLLARARYAVDSAVHELHQQMLAPEFAGARGCEEWLDVFCTFPNLSREEAFLRTTAALRAILSVTAVPILDAEVDKVKAAYVVAYALSGQRKPVKLNATSRRIRHRHAKVSAPYSPAK